MLKRLTLAGSLIAASALVPAAPAFAQQDDITLRAQAIDECAADPNNLNYGNQEVCIEARYQELLQANQWGNGDNLTGGGTANGDPYNQFCNSAASRIRLNCPR